ncbi:molybdopterin molybdotransferase MoeA [Streptomyces roseoviridis]|uniref:Molybdopterin molybdenumtransferase n=1 Tax=Streptomyces roseoviridis TaxID=67361 RepID=A0ABV5QNS6_9ACTN
MTVEESVSDDGVDDALALVGRRGTDRAPGGAHAHRATPWPEARAVAARAGTRAAAARRSEQVPLGRALGRVLAEPLHALTDLPSFDTSAMDGWAVAGPGPWRIDHGGSVLAGHAAASVLADGDAVRIATGARVPSGATAVVRSEHAQADAAGQLHARREVVPGQDIRPRGQECRSGDRLLPAGSTVTPAVLGLAAAAGYDELTVRPCPRVEVLVLGDELLTSGLPHEGLIRDALGPLLGPWLRALGAEVVGTRRIGDDAEALYAAVTGSAADVVVTTGGTAAGPVDHVHPVLAKAGATLLVDGVKVRPGHPMLLAEFGPADAPGTTPSAPAPGTTPSAPAPGTTPDTPGTPAPGIPAPGNPAPGTPAPGNPAPGTPAPGIPAPAPDITGPTDAPGGPATPRAPRHLVGLPGNPLAAVSGLLTLAEPLLRALAGRPVSVPYRVEVREEIQGHPYDTRLVPVVRRGAEAVPLHYNGPAMLRGIAVADGMAVVPPGGARPGQSLDVLALPWSAAPGEAHQRPQVHQAHPMHQAGPVDQGEDEGVCFT